MADLMAQMELLIRSILCKCYVMFQTTPTPDIDVLANGKKSVAINLKSPKGIEVFKKLCSMSDVIIEPFRKGL